MWACFTYKGQDIKDEDNHFVYLKEIHLFLSEALWGSFEVSYLLNTTEWAQFGQKKNSDWTVKLLLTMDTAPKSIENEKKI